MPKDTSEEKTTKVVMRPARKGGREFPVVRSYFSPQQNCVIDVLEVEKTIPARLGQPATTAIIHRHVYCQDEAVQAKYKRDDGQFDIPAEVEV